MLFTIGRKTRRLLAPAYFSTLPYCNYIINLIRHYRFTGRYIPREFYIEVTNHCNAQCIMCPHEKMKRKRGHMPWDIFTRIIDQCRPFEGTGLWMNLHKDGEPLLDPLLFDRIGYIRKTLPKSRIQFSSNAGLLSDSIADKLLQNPPDTVVFSVDGTTKDVYEEIRKGLSYEKTVGNVDGFLKKKKASGSGPKVFMQMVVNEKNMHQQSAFRERWEGRADRIVFKGMHSFLVQGTSIHGTALSDRMLSRCQQPFSTMIIFWNGEVGLCCWDYDSMLRLGDIGNNSLLDIFNNETFAEIRAAMLQKDCSHITLCNACSRIYGKDNPLFFNCSCGD